MNAMAVYAFIAAVILGGALVIAGMIYLPRLVVSGGFAQSAPRWVVVLASYVISLIALKIFGTFIFSSWLLLLTFSFAMITLYHLTWPLQEPGTGAALAIIPVSLIAGTLVMMGMSGPIGGLYPSLGIAMLFT